MEDKQQNDSTNQNDSTWKPKSTLAPPRRFTDDGDGFGISTPDKLDETYLFLIERDLDFARLDLNRKELLHLSDKDLRGLAYETLIHFGCGFIPGWILTKSRAEWTCGTYVNKETGERKHLPPPSDRIIIPTPGMRHFNAIALASDRPRMKKEFWKQHAGEKELFYEKGGVSKAEIVIITEGEVDAMSIWQACIERRTDRNFAPVSIIGAGNWKKTLLPNLSTLLKGKKFLLLLDADNTGKTESDKLRKALIQREVPAVSKYLYDELNDTDKKFFGEKVDANDILIKRGGDFLETLIEKILADAQADFEKAQQEINEQGLFAPANMPANDASDKPAPKKNYTSDPKSDVEEIKLILKDYVHASTLGRNEWWSIGAIMFRYGFTVDDFKAWSNDGDPRYNADRCQTEWDSYASKVNSLGDKGYKIGTLIELAKQYGYKPKGHKNPHVTGDETIDRWQKINGVINPDWLAELKDATAQINGLEVVTAANANDISIQRYLGMCRYYSFFASVDEKFFARLRDAKADAKKKIAAWKKDSTQPAPTDADKALAALDIININRKVEACVTQAKRAHQKYIDSTRRKEVDDQREAEHAAYIREQPTTKKEVEDCPVDLILPEGVIFNDEGIKIEDTDKPLDINDKRPIFTACQNLVVPTKIFREPSKHVTQYEIAIKTGKIWRRKVFDGRTLQDARSVSELGNFGAHIAEPRMMAKYFAKIIARNEDNGRLEEIRSYAQPGWHDDDFSEFAYPTGGDDYVVLRNGFDFKQEFAAHGDAEKWKQTFIDAMKRGGAVARIFTGTALAAPLIRPLRTANMQIHIHGDINNGKTALELLAASIFGDPTKLFRTFESTPKNRQAVAAAYNDLPTFLDEMETRPTKEMEKALPQSVYSYFTGKANQANKRDGTAREPFYFSGARLSTGERPILSDNDQTGAFKRIVQIRCKKLFDPKFAATLYPFTSNHFGHFGRPWTKFITENHDTIRKQFNSYVPLFTSQKIYEETQVNSVVAAATAYQYFQICIGAQSDFNEDDFTKDIAAILEILPTNEELSGSERLIYALRSFNDSHPKNFIAEVKSTAPDGHSDDAEALAYETYGKIYNNGEVAYYPTALQKIIEKELGFASAETHITKWNEEGKLITKKDRTSDVIKIAGKSKRVIHFKAGILSGDISNTK